MGRVGYRDAGPARAHVRQLRRLGWPYEPLAKTAGVSAWVVHKLDTGITRRLLSESEAAVLSVPLVPYRSRRGVDGTGTYRRLEALQWQGWPPAVVAARLGLSPYTLRSMAGRGQRVSYRVALGMARVFREMSTAALFAAVFATLYAGHMLADHVLGQTDRQALGKSAPGWRGWGWCLAHVAQYHLVLAAMLAVAGWVLTLPLSPVGVVAGLGFSAVTHAVLDRRWPVVWILRHTGSAPFAETEQGRYVADQSLHVAALWVAALLIAAI
jgi:hypothetical protein